MPKGARLMDLSPLRELPSRWRDEAEQYEVCPSCDGRALDEWAS
jgi:hypothetical protein